MRFLQTILRGIGQVMFQNNSYSGILFLAGIFYNSWSMGLAALFGTIISTITALVLKYPKEDIENGLYGFNGTLTGIALLCFFEVDLLICIALIIAAVLSTLTMFYLKKITPPFTAPFVLVTWLFTYTLMYFFNYPLITSSESSLNDIHVLAASSNSFGQVMFQENVITGLFFLLATLVNNKLMAIYAAYAAILGSLMSWLMVGNIIEINSGLMGYNAILCAIALVGKKWSDFLWISIAIILSTLLNKGLMMLGLITLTAPFVLITWGILKLKSNFTPLNA
ncbi:MAG: urea transporter [Bacteroidetes bacterium]|nr:MAG: urea transporter [Bacteroidota bacterium]MBL1145357.1 urea transporter [Bacteroidota bacterium]NOG58155.1 urea transporter [Bacteroidota bacterium]